MDQLEKDPIDEPAYVGDDEKPGHRAESIYIEFLRESFPNDFFHVERTSTFDQNDRQGVDCVCTIAGKYRFVMDITFRDDEKLNDKMRRTLNSPVTQLKDEAGIKYGEDLPRVLCKGRSDMGYWFEIENGAKAKQKQRVKAEKEEVRLLNDMAPQSVRTKQLEFIQIVLDNANGLAAENEKYVEAMKMTEGEKKRHAEMRELYAKKMEPIKKILEEERKKLKAAA